MGILISDERKWLSTHQKTKVKRMVAEFLQQPSAEEGLATFLRTKVLPSLTWSKCDSTEGGYNRLGYERLDRADGGVDILLMFERTDAEDLKRRLRSKLREKRCLRGNSEDEESRLWKMYHLLRRHVPKDVQIPDPTVIRSTEQRSVFEGMLETMPASDFKTYVQDCLAR